MTSWNAQPLIAYPAAPAALGGHRLLASGPDVRLRTGARGHAEGSAGASRTDGTCGLTYLSAGIAFCFMTQLGRYAQVRKLELRDYRIVQDTGFRRAGSGDPQASPATTLVWLDSEDSAEKNSRMVQMGEQTCYLHTTFRESVELAFTIHRRAGTWQSTP